MLPCGTQEKLLPQFNKKWKPGKLCNRTNILHLHQLTPISTLRHSVPVPKYRPIADALPNWGIRELYEKIPQYHGNGPKGPIHFHRGCLGQYPWQTKQKVDFFLNDPYGNEVSYTYNPLHDPHLERWINMANNRTLLYKKGLITSDLEVICSLKEYNEFRRFLWRIHKDSVNRKIKMKEKQNQEQKQIIYANLNHEKDIAKKVAKLKVLLASKNSNENVINYILTFNNLINYATLHIRYT
ncbi:uncharacterized protein LOC126839279 [Adelges cooleyi]|uniref:uncharacterized protein LOC126839279 n=1 Tax=Adelges cooleyi TaxID=133065 RepID=UPI00217FFA32|nr:uncharacterized protein LOC126839279 [Adelges cooleyi]